MLVVVAATGALTQSEDGEAPASGPRTPIPGAAKSGLFADGVANLATVLTSGWKTYSNATYGYSFMYPPTWEIEDRDNEGHKSPYTGEPAYPLQAVTVRNPLSERDENRPGVNCTDVSCLAPLPKVLGFYVAIIKAHCAVPGDLIIRDKVTVDQRTGDRCVIQSQNDGKSRFVYMSFPIGDGANVIDVAFERGRDVTPSEQAVLETILLTLKFTGGTPRRSSGS